MNVASHSAPTLGILIMVFGMVAIMCVPFFLRSSLNKRIAIPLQERKHRLSIAYVLALALGIALVTTTVLNVGRIYRAPSLGMLGAIVLYILLEVLAGSKSKGSTE
jgi:hypothetical protein